MRSRLGRRREAGQLTCAMPLGEIASSGQGSQSGSQWLGSHPSFGPHEAERAASCALSESAAGTQIVGMHWLGSQLSLGVAAAARRLMWLG